MRSIFRVTTGILGAAVLLGPAEVRAQASHPFSWTISSSSTDPFANSGGIVAGLSTHYLWISCSSLGAQAAELELISSDPGSNPILAFFPAGGVVNAGTATSLLLGIPGCPSGPTLVGSFLTIQSVAGSYCLGPNALTGVARTVDCADVLDWGFEWRSFDFGGGVCEDLFSNCGHQDCGAGFPECPVCCVPDGRCLSVPGWQCPAGTTRRTDCAQCPPPISIEHRSWGRSKAAYR